MKSYLCYKMSYFIMKLIDVLAVNYLYYIIIATSNGQVKNNPCVI